MKDLRVYTLENMAPEVKAVCFAKCSRSSESFQEIADELTESKSSKFHEKWVVGYGHSSVAEHAVLSIAVENISMVATKIIENNRLSSFTEKSSRYQIFDKTKYLKPKKILESEFGDDYVLIMDELFDFYEKITPVVKEYVTKNNPKEPGVPDKAYETMIKGKYCDIVRYLIPLSAQTNLGWTVNARNLEYALRKMYSHPLEEARRLAELIKTAALHATPTLIKYADFNKYLAETPLDLHQAIKKVFPQKPGEKIKRVKLVECDKNALEKIVSALIYKNSNKSYQEVKNTVKKMPEKAKEKIIDMALVKMGNFDWPVRELEYADYTFDMCADWGALGKDIQRHRICTQSSQLLTTELGYKMPEEIRTLKLDKDWEEIMQKIDDLYRRMSKKFPYEAQYVTTHGHRCRMLIKMNLREAHHLIKLRSGKHGHISYRRLAQEMWQEINRVHPALAKYIRVDKS